MIEERGKPRVFVFEPIQTYVTEITTRISPVARLVLATSVEESLGVIEQHFQEEEHPFSKAVIAPGTRDLIKRAYEAEEVIDELLVRGMSGSRIALYTDLHRLSGLAKDCRVKLVLKRADELEKFLGV